MSDEFTQITIYPETGRIIGLTKSSGYKEMNAADLGDFLALQEEHRAIWWLRGFGTCLMLVLVMAGCFGVYHFSTEQSQNALASQELPTLQTFDKPKTSGE